MPPNPLAPAYPPLNTPLVDLKTGLITREWRDYLGRTGSVSASGITELTNDVLAGPGGGSEPATIAPLAVTTGKIADDAVTYAKMQNITAASRLIGRGSAAGAGSPEEITLGAGLLMSGTVLDTSGGGGGGAGSWARVFAVMGA